jgi:hypothetical protein
MGQIETAAAGQQELPSRRRHSIEDRDAGPAARHHLGRHQSGRSGADDRDVRLGFHGGQF